MKKVKSPTLSLIAGPNGSGKTYFSNHLLKEGYITTEPVNLDFIDESVYNQLSANVYNRHRQLSQLKNDFFLSMCDIAIKKEKDFSYECNLRMSQIKPVALFDKAGYNLNLWFFYMPNIERCKERVVERVKNKGHDVDDVSIKYNFEKSLENLDASFNDWNQLIIVDNSVDFVNENTELGINILLIANEGKIFHCSDNFPNPEMEIHLKAISLKCLEWKQVNNKKHQ